jgi:hypothetical protein
MSRTQLSELLALTGLLASIACAAWAGVHAFATFATNDYTPILRRALAWSSISALLAIVSWRSMKRSDRAFALAVLLLDAAVAYEAIRRMNRF